MKGAVLAAIAVAIAASPAVAQVAVEKDAQVSSGVSKDGINAASVLIRASGYSCRSVSSMVRWTWSTGFTVCCNHHQYCYELADKGGNWIVSVK
ncbi:MAG: hypothetical protein AB7P02_05155 [Alphaproteobacteria bacterium]